MDGEETRDESEVVEAVEAGTVEISPDEPQRAEEPKTYREALREKLQAEEPAEQPKPQAEEPKPEETKPAEPGFTLAPADMTAEEKAAFENPTIDNRAVLQGYLARRAHEMRSDYSRKTMDLSTREKSVSGIVSAIEPHRERLGKLAEDPAKLVESALSWDAAFKSDPVTAAREYLEHWGVDPAELLDDSYQGQPAPAQTNGSASELLTPDQVQEMIQNALTQQQQSRSTADARKVIDSFIAEKPILNGDPGTAAQFEQEMAPILQSYRTFHKDKSERELLEMAYNATLEISPTFKAYKQQLDAQANAERSKQEAEKAKQASRSISGGPGSGSPARTYKDFRENLAANLRGSK